MECHEKGPHRRQSWVVKATSTGKLHAMLYVGLDLSRQRLDVHVLDEAGRTVEVLAVHPDADALRTLANRILCHGQEVGAGIESMTGSRFVHDTLERLGSGGGHRRSGEGKGSGPARRQDRQDRRSRASCACPPRPECPRNASAASVAPRLLGSTLPASSIARLLAEAIWHVLTKKEPFAPAGPAMQVVA